MIAAQPFGVRSLVVALGALVIAGWPIEGRQELIIIDAPDDPWAPRDLIFERAEPPCDGIDTIKNRFGAHDGFASTAARIDLLVDRNADTIQQIICRANRTIADIDELAEYYRTGHASQRIERLMSAARD